MTRSDDHAWRQLPAVDGTICAMGSQLVAVSEPATDGPYEALPGESMPSTPAGERPGAVSLTVRTLDAEAESWNEPVTSPPIEANPGSAAGACTSGGAVYLVVTSAGGAMISYTPRSGFRTEERAGWDTLGAVYPTAGPRAVVEGGGSIAVVVDPGTGRSVGLDLPGDPMLRVGSGNSHLLTLVADQSPIITPLP